MNRSTQLHESLAPMYNATDTPVCQSHSIQDDAHNYHTLWDVNVFH